MDPSGPGFGIMITLIVVGATIIPLAFVGLFLYKFFKRQHQSQMLLRNGEPAQAQIISLGQTGTYINNQPEVVVGLNVQRQGQAPYQAQARMVVGMIHMPRVQPGMMVSCKVDPTDPNKVAIDLNAPVAGAMPPMQQQQMAMQQQQMAMQQQQAAQAQYGMMGGQAQAPAQYPQGAQQMGAAPQQQMGAAQQQRTCTNCQTPFPATLTNCPRCGAIN